MMTRSKQKAKNGARLARFAATPANRSKNPTLLETSLGIKIPACLFFTMSSPSMTPSRGWHPPGRIDAVQLAQLRAGSILLVREGSESCTFSALWGVALPARTASSCAAMAAPNNSAMEASIAHSMSATMLARGP